jgi:hypothetical protein
MQKVYPNRWLAYSKKRTWFVEELRTHEDFERVALLGAEVDMQKLTVYRVVTWLILPVVICLSQRLSHACLSITLYTGILRMAQYETTYSRREHKAMHV